MSTVAFQPSEFRPRGLPLSRHSILYREDEVNFCPDCGRSHWYIGRLLAECAYCGTAIPLQDSDVQSMSGGHSRNRRPVDLAWAA